jgi:hypothetical protein
MKLTISAPLLEIAKTLALTGFTASVIFVANPAQAALLNFDLTSSTGGDAYTTGSAVFGTATSKWNSLSRSLSANNVALFDDTGAASGVTISYNRLGSGFSSGRTGTFANLGISVLQTASVTFNGLVSNGNYQLAIFNSNFNSTSYTVNDNTQTIIGNTNWSSFLVQGTNYALFQTTADSSGRLSVALPGGSFATQTFSALQLQSASAVPEPLTILGAMTAAGFGAGFKRKLAKSQKNQEDA